ncbi:MAG: ATP-binding protein [Candidatus Obscuribacterales bacterium]
MTQKGGKTELSLFDYPNMVAWGEYPGDVSGHNELFPASLGEGLAWLEHVADDDRKRISFLLDRCRDRKVGLLTLARIGIGDVRPVDHVIAVAPATGKVGGPSWFLSLFDASNLDAELVLRDMSRKNSGELNGIELTFPPRSRVRYSLGKLVESSADAIISYSLNGSIDSWNQGAENLYGFAAGEAVGKHLSIIVPDDRWCEVEDVLQSLQDGKTVKSFETTRRRKDGSVVQVSVQVAPLRDETGQVIAAFAISRDVTARRQAEEALLRQAETLARSNAELERFAWMVAHDLKEPIRTMATYAHLVADSIPRSPGSELDEMLKFMVEAGVRASDRIQDVLAYSSIGKRKFQLDSVDLNKLVKTVIKDLSQTVAANKARIDVSRLPVLQVNESTMMLLFQNLIANAIKFRGTKKPEVKIESRRDGDEYVFSVADNGIGVDPEGADKVFEMFQRLHPDRFPGTGIGLSICKKVVNMHGGKIWVEPGKDGGSVFYFTIPANPELITS